MLIRYNKYPERNLSKSSKFLCGLVGAPNLFLNKTASASESALSNTLYASIYLAAAYFGS